ncbi:MAG: hypothetical protein JWN76_1263 [Chitinophagaceae bacterium]|nr:hypothetical protein [Chitinophagaceae bacterium]
MKKIIFLFIIFCSSALVNAQPPNVPADKGSVFGNRVTAANAVTVEQLTSLLNTKEGEKKIELKIKGEVVEVCHAEGCWIKIKSTDGSMMVRMKDHKFFVPTVLNGKTIVVDGIAEIKETSVEMLKHYAEDAGKSKAEIDAIKEAKKEIVVQAKGILVV